MIHFITELLKEFPSPSLRTCARFAQLQSFVGRELFAAVFCFDGKAGFTGVGVLTADRSLRPVAPVVEFPTFNFSIQVQNGKGAWESTESPWHTQVAEPLRAMVMGAPLEDARHLA
ncbi:hypothetical protein MKW98_014501 [Papaver atlanticum]|uniref:Uncharacterized protein n=1 Tax=Papaver atlanticum TaxID=357466 RepID=A0AAD4SLU8_9MAGN|nr:hypothetical protein MKW98_014501 [Papaver atlanticum]